MGLISPIYKKGDKNNVDNYRGITLLSCVGKLFTSILNNRINKWAEENKILDDFQFGFREQKSTVDAMFLLQNIIDISLKNKNALYASFIDLKKAFDSANHQALWFKLAKNGMNSKLISLLKDMYSKMKLCVKSTYINNISNHPCYCNKLLQSTFTTQSSCNRCASCYNEQNDICYFSPLAGVFQGESLSPVLFSFFVNDINEFMKDGHNI